MSDFDRPDEKIRDDVTGADMSANASTDADMKEKYGKVMDSIADDIRQINIKPDSDSAQESTKRNKFLDSINNIDFNNPDDVLRSVGVEPSKFDNAPTTNENGEEQNISETVADNIAAATSIEPDITSADNADVTAPIDTEAVLSAAADNTSSDLADDHTDSTVNIFDTSNDVPDTLSCDECRELICDYVSDNLEESDRLTVEAHLANCETCRAELDDVKDMLGVLAGAAAPALPANLISSVHDELEAAALEVKAEHDASAETFPEKIKNTFSGIGSKIGSFIRHANWRIVAPAAICAVLVAGVAGSGIYQVMKSSDEIYDFSEDEAVASAKASARPSASGLDEYVDGSSSASPSGSASPRSTAAASSSSARTTAKPSTSASSGTTSSNSGTSSRTSGSASSSGTTSSSSRTSSSSSTRTTASPSSSRTTSSSSTTRTTATASPRTTTTSPVSPTATPKKYETPQIILPNITQNYTTPTYVPPTIIMPSTQGTDDTDDTDNNNAVMAASDDTSSDDTSVTPAPTDTPSPTATPAPTQSAAPTASPGASSSPTSSPGASPSSSPSASPSATYVPVRDSNGETDEYKQTGSMTSATIVSCEITDEAVYNKLMYSQMVKRSKLEDNGDMTIYFIGDEYAAFSEFMKENNIEYHLVTLGTGNNVKVLLTAPKDD